MKASAAIPGQTWEKAAHTSRGKELEIVAINGQEKTPTQAESGLNNRQVEIPKWAAFKNLWCLWHLSPQTFAVFL